MPGKKTNKIIDIRGLARLITGIESRDPLALRQLAGFSDRAPCHAAGFGSAATVAAKLALPKFGRASSAATKYQCVIGITGPPGAGKSTIADGIIKCLRNKDYSVGVVAIDPSSPFSGGALLGDRIRMQGHAGDSNVFIRSLGSRGSHGGLSRATRDIVRAMKSYGFDYIIIETVGVGQTELDIMEIADVTVVVLVPESGDMIQTMKAGLLEIADIFVVNKADRDGAEQMQKWLKGMFDTGAGVNAEAAAHHGIQKVDKLASLQVYKLKKEIPVLLTTANIGAGFDELMKAIAEHLKFVRKDKLHNERKKQVLRQEFFEMCAEEFKSRLFSAAAKDKGLKNMIADVETGRRSPYEALKVIDKFVKFGKGCVK